jgi:hypothetical protein
MALKLAGLHLDFCSVGALKERVKVKFELLKQSLPHDRDGVLVIDNSRDAKRARFEMLCRLLYDEKARDNKAQIMRYAGFKNEEIHKPGGGATTDGTWCRRHKDIIDNQRAAPVATSAPASAPLPPPLPVLQNKQPAPPAQQPDRLLDINVDVEDTREQDVLSPLTAALIICDDSFTMSEDDHHQPLVQIRGKGASSASAKSSFACFNNAFHASLAQLVHPLLSV